MKAHIINIGDELLIGQVVNTNASYMAEELNKLNVKVTGIAVIADDKQAIIKQLTASMAEAELILITGGLGPTKDDITKTTLCEFFHSELTVHEPTLENVRAYFTRRGLEFTAVNHDQALVPKCCKVMLNKVGTAPCMVFETEKNIIISMPGVPFEMKWLMCNEILPYIESKLGNEAIVHKTVLTFGIGESFLADKISAWEDSLPDYIRLAYLPEAGKVRLRLSAYGDDHKKLENEVALLIEKLQKIIGDNIYGYDNDTISLVIGRLLTEAEATISTAESCTGGLVGHKIVESAGASAYYTGGIISYSNDIKESQLGVSHNTLEEYGAVSENTAREMAEGCRKKMGTDYSIATTGISGPGGGSEEKPMGLVYIAISSKEKTICNKYVFTTTREQHQERVANQALFDFWNFIKNKK